MLQHLPLPIGQLLALILGSRHRDTRQDRSQIAWFEIILAAPHVPDTLGQRRGRTVLPQNAGDTLADHLGGLQLADAGGYHQYAAGKSNGLRFRQEIYALAV